MTDRDQDDFEDTATETEDSGETSDGDWGDEDFDGDIEDELGDDLEEEIDGELEAGVDDVDDVDDVAVGDDGGDDDESDEALDELEAEELEMLTDDEESETLIVDEAAELRAIRRAELAMEGEAGSERGADEFVCSNCFLVLKRSQLANLRQMLCRDCAA